MYITGRTVSSQWLIFIKMGPVIGKLTGGSKVLHSEVNKYLLMLNTSELWSVHRGLFYQCDNFGPNAFPGRTF